MKVSPESLFRVKLNILAFDLKIRSVNCIGKLNDDSDIEVVSSDLMRQLRITSLK